MTSRAQKLAPIVPNSDRSSGDHAEQRVEEREPAHVGDRQTMVRRRVRPSTLTPASVPAVMGISGRCTD